MRLNKFLNEISKNKITGFMGFYALFQLSYLRLRKGQVSILRPRANNAMKYLLCETILHLPVIETGALPWKGNMLPLHQRCNDDQIEEFNPHNRSLSGHCELNTGPIDLQSTALPTELCPVGTGWFLYGL